MACIVYSFFQEEAIGILSQSHYMNVRGVAMSDKMCTSAAAQQRFT